MNWYYESAGQQQGPVSDVDLDRLLAEGKITLDTLVWREGMAAWTPLRAARPAAGPAPAAPVPAPGITFPAQPAPSADGGSDVPQPGWIRCSLTGRYFPPSEIIYLEGKPYCAAAKPQVVASLQSGGILPTAGERNGPAWEQRESLGTWAAIVETVKAVLTTPVQCFSTMRQTGGLGGPIVFWLLTGGVGMMVSTLFQVLFQGAIAGMATAGSTGGTRSQALGAMGLTGVTGVIVAVLVPAFGVLSLFIQSGIIHLMLMMLKGANRPYETTFRTIAYANGATGILALIPVCGAYIAGLWGIVAICIGLGRAQETTTGKGVAAVLLPIAICCLAYVGLIAVIFGIASSSSKSFGP